MGSQHLVVTRLGNSDVMEFRSTDMGPPGPGHAVVRVQAAGVSYGDILLRLGVIPGSPKPPFVPGFDVAGVIEAVGEGVRGLKVGDPVVALLHTGGYSERLTVAAERLVRRPDGAGPVESAAAALNYFIAYQMLHRIAETRTGQRILVHGASGGVGTAFLQLAKLAEIECWGSASKAKLDLVAKYGGHAIDYRNQDFVQVVRGLPGGRVDAVFDPIGGSHFNRSYSVLRRGGIMVGYGQSAALVNGKPNMLIGARGFLGGIVLPKLLPDGRRTVFYNAWSLEKTHPEAYQEDLSAVLRMVADGSVEPLIDRTLPLRDAAQAQGLLERGEVTGKVVLTMDGG